MDVCTFSRLNGCSILNRANCKNCSFFKTEKELREGRSKANERIEALSPEYSHSIKEKYYGKGFRHNKIRGII